MCGRAGDPSRPSETRPFFYRAETIATGVTLASSGVSLVQIGKLLGHTKADTTLRYAHVLEDALTRATNTAGAILSGKKKAPVVPIRGRR